MNMENKKAVLFAGLLLVMAILACNINNPKNLAQPNLAVTITAQVLSIQQTSQAKAAPAAGITETPAAAPVAANPSTTNTTTAPSATPTPQSPQVITSALCWVGPGTKYVVVSSLNSGQTVEVIGRGSIDGWFIINNPRYHDPCWVQASALKLDASFDINALKIFNPPPLPTNTPKPTPVPSPTPI